MVDVKAKPGRRISVQQVLVHAPNSEPFGAFGPKLIPVGVSIV